jgi:dienelactone hydrolase
LKLRLRPLLLAVLVAAALLGGAAPAHADGPTTLTGTLPDGATWKAEVPSPWNGTLILYNHGYVPPIPGIQNPAIDVSDPFTGGYLLSQGYALAGSSYASIGWAVADALRDQLAVLDVFAQQVGKPKATYTWGDSLGGMITAGLVQVAPRRFTGALPMCGVLAGGVGIWNQGLDGAYALKTLLAPDSPLQLVHITDPGGNLNLAEQGLAAAQATPQGRARIALAAALADIPGWFDPATPEPARNDVATQEENQFRFFQQQGIPFEFAFRAELEARAGGNPSWNTGVNYAEQLRRSADRHEVEALYRQAGLRLSADLAALNKAPRVSADAPAVRYLTRFITYDGDLSRVPVLTIHTTGDTLVVPENERAYASVVARAGDSGLLREAFVHRAGHCTMTPAERIAALQALFDRVRTGRWDGLASAAALNARAAALPSSLQLAPPSYVPFQPAPFLRPFDRRSG